MLLTLAGRRRLAGRWIFLLSLALAACGPPRSIDGTGNDRSRPESGAAGTALRRLAPPDYGDGVWTMAGAARPSPRTICNFVNAEPGPRPNAAGASAFLWQWGQFLDHDLDLTGAAEPPEPAPIPVPIGDPFFDPFFTGSATIGFHRSLYDHATGTHRRNPRQQLNEVTAWIDASMVYGSDAVRAAALRATDGSGRLATSAGDLLPFNEAGLPNAGGTGAHLFLAGDVRSNEQAGLTAMHTLFVREHNRVADLLHAVFPRWSGERVYQAARKWVGALIQEITYREYLPALLGPHAPSVQSRYRPRLDPQIANEFSTALFRLGHSQLNARLLRLDAEGDEIAAGHLRLRDAFFNPQVIIDDGIDPLLRGFAAQMALSIDPFIVEDVRNFLFGPPGAGGFDLASLNIQRGRDHGLPGYNALRAALGLGAAADYDEISSDPEVQQRLAAAYGPGRVDDVDLWVGALAEDHVDGALVGELVAHVLVDQFERLRDADRFWYRRNLHPAVVRLVEQMRLSDVIRLNTDIGAELPDDTFHVAP